jgi:hypothetical protein
MTEDSGASLLVFTASLPLRCGMERGPHDEPIATPTRTLQELPSQGSGLRGRRLGESHLG